MEMVFIPPTTAAKALELIPPGLTEARAIAETAARGESIPYAEAEVVLDALTQVIEGNAATEDRDRAASLRSAIELSL